MNKSKMTRIIIICAAVAIVGAFLVIMLTRQVENQVTISGNTLNIQAPYGQQVDLSEVLSIELLDGIPQVEKKIEGSDTAVSINGSFNVQGYGPCSCYLAKRDQPPCILVKLKNGHILLNETTPDKTRELYKSLTKQ